jgi:hypothetical protein
MNHPDALENISQHYIDHLRFRKQRADEELKTARELQSANNDAFREANEWQASIHSYWQNLKATDKKYKDLHQSIEHAVKSAKIITQNTNEVQEAVETLVCVVRETSKETDSLKNKIHDLKNRLSTVTNKGNIYLALITDLEARVSDATKANEAAIRAVLDLLKEVYLLHISLSGVTILEKIRIKIEEHWLSLECGHETWMEFHIKINVLDYLSTHSRGLAENLQYLLELLTQNHAYPLEDLSKTEKEALYIDLVEDDPIPTFPLKKEIYFRDTHKQHEDAEQRQEKAEKNKKTSDTFFEGAEARFKALEAALLAAGNAKVATGGLLVNN